MDPVDPDPQHCEVQGQSYRQCQILFMFNSFTGRHSRLCNSSQHRLRRNAEEFAEEEEEEEEEGDAVRDDGYGWDVVPPEEIVHVEDHPHQEEVEHVLDEEWEAEQHFVPGCDAEAADIARRQLGAQRREALHEAMP
jgi:hypothetical protein